MHPILRNILSVLAGILGGCVVNYGILLLGQYAIPLPDGADVSNKHFLTVFLAHALGTLGGAFTASRLAGNGLVRPSLVVSVFFLAAGTQMVITLPAPMWFNVADLVFAYVPMGLIGYKLAKRNS
jgi:hypothetical protein